MWWQGRERCCYQAISGNVDYQFLALTVVKRTSEDFPAMFQVKPGTVTRPIGKVLTMETFGAFLGSFVGSLAVDLPERPVRRDEA